jgi:uncharacterized UBP type Zn finger protein
LDDEEDNDDDVFDTKQGHIKRLVDMGFDEQKVMTTLNDYNFNVEEAMEILLRHE